MKDQKEQAPDLNQLRDRIDAVDAELVRLFEERMSISEEIASAKARTGREVYDGKREEEKISAVRALAHSEADKRDVEELFRKLMALSRRRQHAILGQDPVLDESEE